MNRIAKVAVDLSLDREFDYMVPDELVSRVEIGSRVSVPFGRRHVNGFVVGFADQSAFEELKPIAKVIGDHSLITGPVMELARWMSSYYLAPFETCVRAVLPAVVRRKANGEKKQLVVALNVEEASSLWPADNKKASGNDDASTINYFDPEEPVERIRKYIQDNPKQDRRGIQPLEPAAAMPLLRSLTPAQQRVLQCLETSGSMLLSELTSAAETTVSPVKTLEKKGLVTITQESIYRDPHAGTELIQSRPPQLMREQKEALERIMTAMDAPKPGTVLLHGVTGSGKTEVYLHAIRHALEQGKGAIVLVPEIALTPQTVDRFRARFADKPERVAVLHSSLSEGERYDEWHRIRSGEAIIVIGARSALFAPVERLGLIVVDEEHEPTYKQDETPRYSARDAAVMRGHREGCAVVLGSATPALESYCNAQSGRYTYVGMPLRVDDRNMPEIRVVDMRLEKDREGRHGLFSKELVEAIYDRLNRAEQTMIFLNRRGFSSSLVCPDCGHVAECDHCSVKMTYHKARKRLICHTCGDERAAPNRCPKCGSPEFNYSGAGTEKIEEVMEKLFPKASIARMDSDTMRKKNAHRDLLAKFRVGKIDILIGTQMIAKGLDFPNVTLVGVVNPDHALHMPDFRAGERVFQLLTQVAGRAGRGEVAGQVLVQTYTPHHPAIQFARRMDFEGFCDQELAFRKELFYPPYAHLSCITLRGKHEDVVEKVADALFQTLNQCVGKNVMLSPVTPAPISRMRGEYRYQILLRAEKTSETTRAIRRAVEAIGKWPRGVKCTIDIDAMSLL